MDAYFNYFCHKWKWSGVIIITNENFFFHLKENRLSSVNGFINQEEKKNLSFHNISTIVTQRLAVINQSLSFFIYLALGLDKQVTVYFASVCNKFKIKVTGKNPTLFWDWIFRSSTLWSKQNNVPLMKSVFFLLVLVMEGQLQLFFLTSVLIKILLLWVWIFKKAKQYIRFQPYQCQQITKH